jgi:hypothetical protein
MVIWSRLGILGLIIPTVFIVIAMIACEPPKTENPKPVKPAKVADDAEETPAEDPVALKTAELKRAVEREKAIKRTEATGYLIGSLVSAAVLWPLGRWMNKSEVHMSADQQIGQLAESQGGGHTLFFIPMEYWAFIWVVIGLFKFLGSA